MGTTCRLLRFVFAWAGFALTISTVGHTAAINAEAARYNQQVQQTSIRVGVLDGFRAGVLSQP